MELSLEPRLTQFEYDPPPGGAVNNQNPTPYTYVDQGYYGYLRNIGASISGNWVARATGYRNTCYVSR